MSKTNIYIKSSINVAKLFGKDRAQEDENLKHYFIKTRQFVEIKNGTEELVLGRKGAGKSALFTMLIEEMKESRKAVSVKISFNGYDFIHINELIQAQDLPTEINDDFKYSLAWKDFILQEIAYTALSTDI